MHNKKNFHLQLLSEVIDTKTFGKFVNQILGMPLRFAHYSFILFFSFLSCTMVLGQCWPRADKLVPNLSSDNTEEFGSSVDFENDIAVVSAPSSDSLKLDAGIVYLFKFEGGAWKKIASLFPTDPQPYQRFGFQVMIRNDQVFVADPNHYNGSTRNGTIYVFNKPAGGWSNMTESTQLTSSDSNAFSFGSSMDFFGGTLIVGAPYSTNSSNVAVGAAYIFTQQGSNWNQIAKLTSSHPFGSTFGTSVAIKKNLAVVVAPEEKQADQSTELGATYVFEKNDATAWTNALPIARLTKLDNSKSISYLGYGLAIDETRQTVFVGDNLIYDNIKNQYNKGFRAYVKPVTGWRNMSESSLYTNDEPSRVWLGSLRFEEPYLYFSGPPSIKIFRPDEFNSWNTLTTSSSLINLSPAATQRFGVSFQVHQNRVIAGAPANITFDNDQFIVQQSPLVHEFKMPLGGWPTAINNQQNTFTYIPKTAAGFAFGTSMDMEGEYLVVGSPRDNDGGRSSGVAYVFHLEGLAWKKIATLSPSDGEPYDYFGGTVSISRDHIAISAQNKNLRDATGKIIDYSQGAVYIFEKRGAEWADMTETYKIVRRENESFDDREDDYFGVCLDMDYPYLAVSRFDTGSRPNKGSVFVFVLTGTSTPILEATLNPSSRDNINNFGINIKINGGTIIVASGGLRGALFDNNQIFVYSKSGSKWVNGVESALLFPSDISEGSSLTGIAFGSSIDVTESGSTVIVGAPGWSDAALGNFSDYFKGAAYIYEKPATGWKGYIKENVRLTVPGQPGYGCMGVSVHIEDRYAVVGSPQNYFYTYGANRVGPGRVYFYQKPENGWTYKTPDKTITGDEAAGTESDYFGSSVDGVYGYLMIGALADDNQKSVDAGSVYVYTEYPFIYPSQTSICDKATPIRLRAFPEGGRWSGLGISNPLTGDFDPSLVENGLGIIKYKVDDCDASNTLRIQVKEGVKPFKLFAGDSTYFCGIAEKKLSAPELAETTYSWSFAKTPGAFLSITNATSSSLNSKEEGFYSVKVANSCSSQSSSVWVGDLYPNAGNGFRICMNDRPIQLNGNYRTGIWSGKGISSSGNFSPTIAGLGEHVIDYSVSPFANCVYKDTIRINVKGIPSITINADGVSSFCVVGNTRLTATLVSQTGYRWYVSTEGSNFTQLRELSNILVADKIGNYKVSAFNEVCTQDTFYKLAPTFKPKINPAFDSLSFCGNSAIKIEAESIPLATYTWLKSTESGLIPIEQTIGSFEKRILESGTYRLKIETSVCEYLSPEMKAHRLAADSIFVPSIITPNGDRVNDTLQIFASESIEDYSLVVFNRYGTEVFNYRGADRSTGWNGTDLSTGVYFIWLSYFDKCENRIATYKGPLSIVR